MLLTKGGKCRKFFTACQLLLLVLCPSVSVCSLWLSDDAISEVNFGTIKQISIMRAKPAEIKVYPKIACTYKYRVFRGTPDSGRSMLETHFCGKHESLSVI